MHGAVCFLCGKWRGRNDQRGQDQLDNGKLRLAPGLPHGTAAITTGDAVIAINPCLKTVQPQ
jgi:hypothetical protein